MKGEIFKGDYKGVKFRCSSQDEEETTIILKLENYE